VQLKKTGARTRAALVPTAMGLRCADIEMKEEKAQEPEGLQLGGGVDRRGGRAGDVLQGAS